MKPVVGAGPMAVSEPVPGESASTPTLVRQESSAKDGSADVAERELFELLGLGGRFTDFDGASDASAGPGASTRQPVVRDVWWRVCVLVCIAVASAVVAGWTRVGRAPWWAIGGVLVITALGVWRFDRAGDATSGVVLALAAGAAGGLSVGVAVGPRMGPGWWAVGLGSLAFVLVVVFAAILVGVLKPTGRFGTIVEWITSDRGSAAVSLIAGVLLVAVAVVALDGAWAGMRGGFACAGIGLVAAGLARGLGVERVDGAALLLAGVGLVWVGLAIAMTERAPGWLIVAGGALAGSLGLAKVWTKFESINEHVGRYGGPLLIVAAGLAAWSVR